MTDKEIAETFGVYAVTVRVARMDGVLDRLVRVAERRQRDDD